MFVTDAIGRFVSHNKCRHCGQTWEVIIDDRIKGELGPSVGFEGEALKDYCTVQHRLEHNPPDIGRPGWYVLQIYRVPNAGGYMRRIWGPWSTQKEATSYFPGVLLVNTNGEPVNA